MIREVNQSLERIVRYFRSYGTVSDKAWTHFRKCLDLHYYNKGDVISPAQELCNNIYFILDGVARSYLQKPDGRDFTWFFHYDKDYSFVKQFILIDYPNFNLNEPSIYGFQALSSCKLACLTKRDLVDIFQQFPEFLPVEKQLSIKTYQQNNQRVHSLLTKSAKERLKEFEQEQGELFDMIPHYHIASFLGITPQHLCQIRSGCA